MKKIPTPGTKVIGNKSAPTGIQGKTYIVKESRKICMDPWENCAYGKEEEGKFVILVVTTTGEQLHLDWVDEVS